MEIRMEASAAEAAYNNSLYEMNQLNGQITRTTEDLTAAPVSIDPCVLASRHETIFEGSQIEGALSRRRWQSQGRGRKDLLGVDAHHKALAKEASGERGCGARAYPRQAFQERSDAQRVAAQAP